jgi:hypothetical protein
MSEPRYLLVKGIAGLGDRLMTLGRAIQLARITRRILMIDWAQESWNHDDPPKGFWHYFDLTDDVPVVREDAATYKMIDGLTSATAIPAQFTGRLRRLDWTLNRQMGRLFIDGVRAQLTDREIITATEQVVVYLAYCAGTMETIVSHLRFRTPPMGDRYDVGVHFRNTDKVNSVTEMITRVKEIWSTGQSIWLATDDVSAVATFRIVFGEAVYAADPPPRPTNGGGIHHASAEELAVFGTTKEVLNHAMIQDVYRLRDAAIFVGCPNSLFTRLVTVLRLRRQ